MPTARSVPSDELFLASRALGPGLRQNQLSLPTIHCGGCMQKIEQALAALPRVEYARVNLSTKRVIIRWEGEVPPPVIETLSQIGYEAHLYDASLDEKDAMLARLLRALAVAGFAAGNIMLLSSIVSEYLIGAIQGAIIIIAMLVQRSLIRKS